MGIGLRTRMGQQGTPSPDAENRGRLSPSRWLGRLQGRLLVDRALQFNLVTRTVLLVLFIFAVVNAVVFAPFATQLREGAIPDPAITEAFLSLHAVVWPAAGCCLVTAIASALFLSHRIAGPLFRVKQAMRVVEQGNLPANIETRPRDYFKDEVRVLNGMIQGLRAQLAEIDDATIRVEHAIDEGAAFALDHPAAQQAFAEAHRRNDVVRQLLAAQGAGRIPPT